MRRRQNGFSLAEMLAVTAVLTVVFAAGQMALVMGQSVSLLTRAQVQVQGNLRLALSRIGGELRESGTDKDGTFQVTIQDGAGTGGSDILRFSIPVCPCGSAVLDANGDVAVWGAPLVWGQTGCLTSFPVESNGKVKICHHSSEDPENPQSIQVAPSAVRAHLAHGDTLGDCGSCTPPDAKYVEYRLDSSGQLLRRVLNASLSTVREDVLARALTDLQVSVGSDQKSVTVTVSVAAPAQQGRQVAVSDDREIVLHNGGS